MKLKTIINSKCRKEIYAYNTSSNVINCLIEQVENCKSISNYLSTPYTKEIIKDVCKNEIYNIFTITSAIEEFECLHSTIEKYYESEFSL